MQLVAYGAQDIYLTGNPQITFFKVVYRRHTNFSMESIEQTFNGTADWGKKVTCTISRNGDLVHRVYLQVKLPQVRHTDGTNASTFRWLNHLGHVLVKNVEVEIGGQRIDKHYSHWLHIWSELTLAAGHKDGYQAMIGNVPALTMPSHGTNQGDVERTNQQEAFGLGNDTVTPDYTLYVPLQFWFCRNPGLALPLIALQYHEVKINLEFRQESEVCYVDTTTNVVGANGQGTVSSRSLEQASLWVDYIYLDTDERRRFAQVSHEYLIEQLQFTGEESVSTTSLKVKLNFNHPCKELVWVVQRDEFVDRSAMAPAMGQQHFNFSDRLGTAGYLVNGGVSNGFLGAWNASAALSPLNSAQAATTTGSTADAALFGVGNAGLPNAEDIGNNAGPPGGLGALTLANLVNASSQTQRVVDGGHNPVVRAKLQLNGHDRFAERDGSYFNLVQPYQHHTNIPSCGINVYSFGLQPEEHQPSGTCNMSRIDNATLQLNLTDETVGAANGTALAGAITGAKVRVYAVNYNVLRIMSGMGGLAYSN